MTIYADKQQLRQKLRQMRKALNPVSRMTATKRVNRLLYPFIRRHKRIGAYWAMGSELSLLPLIVTAQHRGATVYLPYIENNKRQLWFSPCPYLASQRMTKRFLRQQNLYAHKRRIPQFSGDKIRAHKLNTLLIPLLGIDSQGHRLGQGGGYYDATLTTHHQIKPKLVGVGFSCQQVKNIATEQHDINIPIFVSENGYQYFVNTNL